MSKNDPTPVGKIVDQLKRTTDLGTTLQQARIWEEWPAVVGPQLCSHGNPVSVKENTLHIEAESPVWMHKFAYRKWDIVKQVNRLAGRELISDVFISLAPDQSEPSSPA